MPRKDKCNTTLKSPCSNCSDCSGPAQDLLVLVCLSSFSAAIAFNLATAINSPPHFQQSQTPTPLMHFQPCCSVFLK